MFWLCVARILMRLSVRRLNPIRCYGRRWQTLETFEESEFLENKTTNAFKDIHTSFAGPPVEPLRFKPPVKYM